MHNSRAISPADHQEVVQGAERARIQRETSAQGGGPEQVHAGKQRRCMYTL